MSVKHVFQQNSVQSVKKIKSDTCAGWVREVLKSETIKKKKK